MSVQYGKLRLKFLMVSDAENWKSEKKCEKEQQILRIFFLLNLVYHNLFKVVRRVVKIMSGFGLSINGQHVYCGDFIFSGHTMILILAYLIITECKYTQTLFPQSLKFRIFFYLQHILLFQL